VANPMVFSRWNKFCLMGHTPTAYAQSDAVNQRIIQLKDPDAWRRLMAVQSLGSLGACRSKIVAQSRKP
jgi:hypothetical protein